MRNIQNYCVGGDISLRQIKWRMRNKENHAEKREKRKVRQINMKIRFSCGVIKGHNNPSKLCFSKFTR